MSFLCRVQLSPQVESFLDECPILDACARARRGDVFHTVTDARFLRGLVLRARAAEVEALKHFFRDEPVCWIAGGGRTRAHVRRLSDTSGQTSRISSADQFAHDWAKMQLFRLGETLKQSPKLEHTLIDGRRCDVSWRAARIAWEIDITAQAELDHELRVQRTADAGYRMISLIDRKDKNQVNGAFPRLRFPGLKKAEHYKTPQRPWASAYIGGVVVLTEGENPAWTWRSWVAFDAFCHELLRQQLDYLPLGRRSFMPSGFGPSYAWMSPADQSRHLELIAAEEKLRARPLARAPASSRHRPNLRDYSHRSEDFSGESSYRAPEFGVPRPNTQVRARQDHLLPTLPRESWWRRLLRILGFR